MRILSVVLCTVVLAVGATGCKKSKEPTVTGKVMDRFDAMEEVIDDTVKEKQKKALLLILHGENRLAFLQLKARWMELTSAVRNNPNLTREAVEQRLERFYARRAEVLTEVARNRMQMRGLVTRDQWDRICGASEAGVSGGEGGS